MCNIKIINLLKIDTRLTSNPLPTPPPSTPTQLATVENAAPYSAAAAGPQLLRVENLLHILARTDGRLQMPRRPRPRAVLRQDPVQATPQKVLAPPLAVAQVQVLGPRLQLIVCPVQVVD